MADTDFFEPLSGEQIHAVHSIILSRAAGETGIIDGNRITPTSPVSMSLIVDAGTIKIDNVSQEVDSATIELGSSDPTLARMDLIIRNVDGDVQVVQGALSEIDDQKGLGNWHQYNSPLPAAVIPAGAVLALIMIQPAALAISEDDIWMIAGKVGQAAHTQNTDEYLDYGGANQISAAQARNASTKAHTQGTDQSLDYGGPNQTNVVNIKDAVTKKHSQNSDTYLDYGGANECSAAAAKEAVSKKHNQGTDQALDYGGDNQCFVADVRDAIDKAHTPATESFNCAFNSSFEFVLGEVILGWANIGANALGTQDNGLRDGYGGSKAIKITSGGSGNEGFGQVFKALKASTTYLVKVWMKATSGDTAKCWTTGAASNLSISSTSASGEWKTGTFTTDSTPTDVVLCIGSDTNADVVWFDCIMVVEGSFAPARYFHDPEYDKPVQLLFGKGDGTGVIATGQFPDIYHALASWEILGWEIIESSGNASNITFDIWKKASFPPANADSIVGTGKPAVSSGAQATGMDLSGWSSTLIPIGDYVAAELEVNSAGKAISIALILRRR